MSETSITRREVLKGAVGLAALGALPAGAAARARPRRDRVAIIGAGAGGVAAAYFLAGRFDVDVFEARSRIGGHCDSRVIELPGAERSPSISARSSSIPTRTRSTSRCWRSSASTTLNAPAPTPRVEAPREPVRLPGRPAARRSFSSSHPLETPQRAGDFAIFTQLARQAVLSDLSWEITVDAWIRSLPLRPGVQDGRPVSVDHGDDRVLAGRRAANVGALDPADVRAGVPGQPPRDAHDVQLEASACRGTCSACWTAARRAGAPPRAGAGPVSRTRRLVPADARRAGRGRTGTWC